MAATKIIEVILYLYTASLILSIILIVANNQIMIYLFSIYLGLLIAEIICLILNKYLVKYSIILNYYDSRVILNGLSRNNAHKIFDWLDNKLVLTELNKRTIINNKNFMLAMSDSHLDISARAKITGANIKAEGLVKGSFGISSINEITFVKKKNPRVIIWVILWIILFYAVAVAAFLWFLLTMAINVDTVPPDSDVAYVNRTVYLVLFYLFAGIVSFIIMICNGKKFVTTNMYLYLRDINIRLKIEKLPILICMNIEKKFKEIKKAKEQAVSDNECMAKKAHLPMR